jgi:hypothetical protein
VRSHFTIILLIVGVFIQCSTIRTCALEQVVLGASCHDPDPCGAGSDGHELVAVAHHSGAPVDGHESCRCEGPKGAAQLGVPAADPGAFAAVVPVPFLIAVELPVPLGLGTVADALPPRPPQCLRTPLLI